MFRGLEEGCLIQSLLKRTAISLLSGPAGPEDGLGARVCARPETAWPGPAGLSNAWTGIGQPGVVLIYSGYSGYLG